MPANSVKINDKIEYIVPDSWMPILVSLLEKCHEVTDGEGHYSVEVYEVSGKRKCPNCKGAGDLVGRDEAFRGCSTCNGTGQIIDEKPVEAY